MQIHKLTRHLILALTAVSTMGWGGLQAQTSNADAIFTTQPSADGIAAVVNNEVITLRNVQTEVDSVTKNLRAQKIPMPEPEVLKKQVLQRLIDERLLYQEAANMGLYPQDVNIDEAAEMIAGRNNLTVTQLRKEIEKSGVDWNSYLKGLRQEVLVDQIRQRVIDPRIMISDSEINLFLKNQGIDPNSTSDSTMENASMSNGDAVVLAQILVRIPEGASQSVQAELKQKAESLLKKARQGADFSGLAAASSDGPEALQGGVMGERPLEGWPDIFVQAIKDTAPGQVANIVRSSAGYHILKVVNKALAPQPSTARAGAGTSSAGAAEPLIVTQTNARHILIKLNEITDDARAKDRIDLLVARLRNGESFEALAKVYSDDATAPQGGDLGWLHPGETVPAFEQVMDALAIGETSAPVRTQFGWHIIRLEDRRERNVGKEYRRMQARQALFEQRVEPAFDDWFNQIRSQAFIDNRLVPEASSGRRK